MEVGRTYKTQDGRRSFYIFGKKKISTTGFFFAGEETKTGLVAYFNHKGEHPHQSDFYLETDPCLYLPINKNGTVAAERFTKKDRLPDGDFRGYLKINPLSYDTVSFVNTERLI